MSANISSSKEKFIQLALDCGVLRFGQFILKSGRESPYFFNAGLFYQGQALRLLGQFYAQRILEENIQCRQLFGPAYKGLPLATATAIALAEKNVDCTVTFNRKEKKDHGEGGVLIGAPLGGPTIMIDDVITAGTAFREAKVIIEQTGGYLSAVVIALNRCERGAGDESAIKDIESQGIKVLSIIDLFDLIHFLDKQGQTDQVTALKNYWEKYGVSQ